ncbi:MAG: LPS export ABC transporter permease LptG, partial [Desulfobacterales bacterium]
MKCLHRYWLKDFFKFFIIIQIMILVLFIFIDYLSRMDKFLEFQIGLDRGLWYVLLKTPFMFMQLTPASLLLAVIVSFGIMNRHMELTALKSSGISVYFLVKPALTVGGILAILMLFLGETIVPITMAKANYIRYQELSGKAKLSKGRKDIWIKSGPTLVHINFFDPVNQTVEGISCTTMGDQFKIESRIDARKGYYEKGEWVFEGVTRQIYDADKKEYLVAALPEVRLSLDIQPEDLGQVSRKTNEMSFSELRSYVKKVANEGYDATTYKV